MDETRAVIPGATVTLAGPEVKHISFSGSNGAYRFENLPAGRYEISISV